MREWNVCRLTCLSHPHLHLPPPANGCQCTHFRCYGTCIQNSHFSKAKIPPAPSRHPTHSLAAQYEGYSPSSQTIRDFWQVDLSGRMWRKGAELETRIKGAEGRGAKGRMQVQGRIQKRQAVERDEKGSGGWGGNRGERGSGASAEAPLWLLEACPESLLRGRGAGDAGGAPLTPPPIRHRWRTIFSQALTRFRTLNPLAPPPPGGARSVHGAEAQVPGLHHRL